MIFDSSKVMPGIKKLPCHIITSGKYCVKCEYPPSKNVRRVDIIPHSLILCIYDKVKFAIRNIYHLHIVGNPCTKYESPS